MRIGLTGGADRPTASSQQAVEAEADGFTASGTRGGARRSARRHGARRPGDHDDRARHRGAADVHLPSGPAGQPRRVDRGDDGPRRAHPRRRPVAPAGDRGRVRPVVRRASARTPRSTPRSSARCCGARACSIGATHFRVDIPTVATPPQPVTLMVSALAPRMLRVAGELTDGTILWMGNARAIETHVRAEDQRGGGRRRPPSAAHRRRSARRGARRRRRGARRPRPRTSPTTACCRTTAASSTSAARPAGRRRDRRRRSRGRRPDPGPVRRRRHRRVGRPVPRRRRPQRVPPAHASAAEGARQRVKPPFCE